MKKVTFIFWTLLIAMFIGKIESAQAGTRYVVIFTYVVDAKRTLKTCDVVKVFDPSKGDRPIKYAVPPQYKASACRSLASRRPTMRKGHLVNEITHYFLNTGSPNKVVTR